MKVVSLLPSATEIVGCVGGQALLVGRSHECNYPPGVCALPILTGATNKFENSAQMHLAVQETLAKGDGLYYIDEELLKELDPDVIVTQSVCAVCSVDFKMVHRFAQTLNRVPKVIDLNPQSLSEVIDDCRVVGEAVGLTEEAEKGIKGLKDRIEIATSIAKAKMSTSKKIEVAFMEWVDPIFIGGHWTPEIIGMAGGHHSLNPPRDGTGAGKSIVVTPEKLLESDPDWVVICPCGLDLDETKTELKPVVQREWWGKLRALKEGRVVLVDGDQMFNRPGPRLVDGLEFLVGLLHGQPDLIPKTFPWQYLQP
ncbi:hypothetical protein BSKO_01756 [Bryopsis sp. KO-2023]|nr:hypothetical protein BSKO_01756 [Bryopsis sp. KO-2023]